MCIMLLFGPEADPRVGNVKYVYGAINIMLVSSADFFLLVGKCTELERKESKS